LFYGFKRFFGDNMFWQLPVQLISQMLSELGVNDGNGFRPGAKSLSQNKILLNDHLLPIPKG